MGSLVSKLTFSTKVAQCILAYMFFGYSKQAYLGDSAPSSDGEIKPSGPKFLMNAKIVAALAKVLNVEKLSDDALLKICRQLDYFCTEEKVSEKNLVKIAETLVDQSSWYHPLLDKSASPDSEVMKSKVPKVRFGKTELNVSVLTCGGMRIQSTWLPDNIPIFSPNRQSMLSGPPQKNLENCIKYCMSLGINHFETARLYGSSEYQMTEALYELMEEGEIEREDFIFQTKIMVRDRKSFLKDWDATWKNVGEKLGYVDLFALHGIADKNEALEEVVAVCRELQKEGKIKHIGFSTHGSTEQIMDLINTEYFSYINIHEHYFGSYHGSGTPDTMGGQGNLACIQRALELDMGVFQISPVDKGGKLYRPSKDVISLVGNELTPIAFALLYGWKTIGFHTASIGVARPSDLDENLAAARLLALSKSDQALKGATKRLNDRAVEKLGAEWVEKGLLNLPSFLDESTDGIAVGHTLWLYNLIECYGMYEYAYDRYVGLVMQKWDKKKSFKENSDAMNRNNLGRAYDETVDLTKALSNHYNPSLALERIKQTHEWLNTKEPLSDEEVAKRGWKKGYKLDVWEEMPGLIDSRAIVKVLLQGLTGGRMGIVNTGPGYSSKTEAAQIRETFS